MSNGLVFVVENYILITCESEIHIIHVEVQKMKSIAINNMQLH